MLTDRRPAISISHTVVIPPTIRSQTVVSGRSLVPGASSYDRCMTQRLSLLDRLPLTATGQEYIVTRHLPLLTTDIKRKGFFNQKLSLKTIFSQEGGHENRLKESLSKKQTSGCGSNVHRGNRGAKYFRNYLSPRKLGLDDDCVLGEDQGKLYTDLMDGAQGLGRYSRHRYGLTDEVRESDGEETASNNGSQTSGKSQPVKVQGSKTSSRKKALRWRTDGTSPLPGGDSKLKKSTINIGHSHIIKFTRCGEAKMLFRKSVRKVMHVLHWMVVLSKKDEKIENQLKTFYDMAQEIQDSSAMKHIEQQTGISFDPKYYRTSKQQFILTNELKRCLTLVSDQRTEEMIQRVVTALQHLESFAEYPLHMQYKLAQVAWYQELPPRRMIIRQGHKAENFYFILSGMGIAKQLVRDEDTGRVINRVIARLQKGQSFGEVALIHYEDRAATVESVTHMQLLVVSREDFLDIFFSSRDGEEPEYVNFCRHVDFLKHWPVDAIQEEPQECLFHYFRRGTVVVQDSRANEWIYIVKSGTCMVLKKLKSVHPQKLVSLRQSSTDETIPKVGHSEPGPRIDSRLSTAPSRLGLKRKPHTISQEMLAYFKNIEVGKNALPRTNSKIKDAQMDQEIDENMEGEDEQQTTLNDTQSCEVEIKPISKSQTSRSQDGSSTNNKKCPNRITPGPMQKSKSIRGVLDAYMYRLLIPFQERQRSMEIYLTRMIEESTKSPNRDKVRQRMMQNKDAEDPCFVQLKKLRPRDSFGLEEIVFDDETMYDAPETSVILVSNGAEMIMISRKFFTKNCNDQVKQFIREMIRPFPSEETLQENLQHKVNWDLYRQNTVNDILTYLKFQKLVYNSNNFLPHI